MRLLIDMNLSPELCARFSALGHEAVHWSSLGDYNAPDIAIMAHATANAFVVLTHDLDFGAILAATAPLTAHQFLPRDISNSLEVCSGPFRTVIGATSLFRHPNRFG